MASLGAVAGLRLWLWCRVDDAWVLEAGEPRPSVEPIPPGGLSAWIPLPESGRFLEAVSDNGPVSDAVALHLAPLVERLVATERANAAVTAELASRYEEIDLLYSIGELLGRSHTVDEIAAVLLREVTAVIGARRAGLRVYQPAMRILHSVATLGTDPSVVPADVSIDAPEVVVARAFRSGRIERGYQLDWVPGEIVAVPIIYAAAGQPPGVIGTLALADRAGGGSFTREEAKLIATVATQIGAALENARLAVSERERERLDQELHLARQLQLRLMPGPAVLRGDAQVAVRSEAAASVGGDFYTFMRMGRGRVGVLLGDVASYGLAAALIAAEVLAAAGIHANSATMPDETLSLLHESLADELHQTEMYLTIFYGMLDRAAGRLIYANAGHAHAFHVPVEGPVHRLASTAPPLGLIEAARFGREEVAWGSGDLLVLFTDGIQDQTNGEGERFGERRILDHLECDRGLTAQEIVDQVFDDLAAFGGGGPMRDDRTLLVLRM